MGKEKEAPAVSDDDWIPPSARRETATLKNCIVTGGSGFMGGGLAEVINNHLDGYSAIYYTYMWSLVIANDLFSRFDREGMHNKETARDYRNLVLGPGGSDDAANLVERFLGRPYNFKAFEAELEKGL